LRDARPDQTWQPPEKPAAAVPKCQISSGLI
jgi:hypothetical protein